MKKYYSKKWENEAQLYQAEVQAIEVQNEEKNKKFKNVFYVKSAKNPSGRMCIFYERTTFNIGDVLIMKGRLVNSVFLVWQLNILMRKADKQNDKRGI